MLADSRTDVSNAGATFEDRKPRNPMSSFDRLLLAPSPFRRVVRLSPIYVRVVQHQIDEVRN